ncbi:MAG TPA: ankyrin repeat domain-containing protein [bacterium]|nr:ankyrin repeat domain-containing protein [bacterium]
MSVNYVPADTVETKFLRFNFPQGRARFMVEKNWKNELKKAIEDGSIDAEITYIFDALARNEFSFDLGPHDKNKPYTLFFDAAAKGKTDIVKFLVKKGLVDVNFKDKKGWTAMDYAQKTRRYDVIHYLVEAGSIH